jgi:uncharacterized coiled-coil protein SlyX
MGKNSNESGKADSRGLDDLAEILDEDHLEFEELLLNIQERLAHLETRVASLATQSADIRNEIGDTREMIETLDAKLDRLLGLMTERAIHPLA